MELELTEDQRTLRDEVRRVLEAQCPPALPRAVHERGETGAALWEQMAALHWPCVAIAESHGGRIEVESQVGRGSTFTVYFPADSP